MISNVTPELRGTGIRSRFSTFNPLQHDPYLRFPRFRGGVFLHYARGLSNTTGRLVLDHVESSTFENMDVAYEVGGAF